MDKDVSPKLQYMFDRNTPPKLVFSYEEISRLDPVSLGALIRQRAHWVDGQAARLDSSPPGSQSVRYTEVLWQSVLPVLRDALRVWQERGYDMDKPYVKYALEAVKRGEEFDKTRVYHRSPPSKPMRPEEIEVLERVIQERRSVRLFTDEDVPDELVNRILQAALWAPCACSLQGYRFIVCRKPELKGLLNQAWRAPIVIYVVVDDRPYQFIKRNRLPHNPEYDVGAALQNMLLVAHALGLGVVWGTFTGDLDRVARALHVPDYARLVTYVVLGWPADNPKFVPRIELSECVGKEGWFFED